MKFLRSKEWWLRRIAKEPDGFIGVVRWQVLLRGINYKNTTQYVMVVNKNDIIAAIPKLSPADLAEVSNAIKANQSLSGFVVQPDLISDWVLSGLVGFMVREGVLPSRGAYQDIKRRNAYKAYLSKLPALMCFLNELKTKASLAKKHEPQLSFLCAKALATYLREMGIFSVSTMLSQCDRIPEGLDRAYPGYAAAGLFRFVISNVDQ
jgi:hypothetical protein